MTDPIADMLTRIRNGLQARHETVQIPMSKLKLEMARILTEEGYVRGYEQVEMDGWPTIKVVLKYGPAGEKVVTSLERVSRPGFRVFVGSKEVPKVLGFIGGTSDRPAPISDNEAAAILNRVQEGVDKPRPKVLFEPGEVVRVNDGPFNDFNGVVEHVNYDKNKVRVAVQILGRSTPVELDFSQVEKV